MSTLGVIVAGGRGARLGLGVPKAAVRIHGATLLERALATAMAVCDDVVVAVPRTLDVAVPERMRVNDPDHAAGPLAGVVAGLAARRHDRAIVLGVDFPLLRPAALAALLDRLADRAAVVPAPGGVPQPLVSVIASSADGALAESLERGERSITAAMLALDPLLLGDVELAGLEGGLENFFNLNTSRDLERAERSLSAPERPRAARTSP